VPTNTTQPTTPQTQRRYGRPATIGALLPKAAAAALDQRGFASGSIISRWSAIVGEDLAAFAVPIEVKFQRQRNDQATLVLQVASGAAATLLQLKAPMLIERVNGFLGYGAISRIQALQGPLPKKRVRAATPAIVLSPHEETEIARATDHVASPEIKSALMELGLAIARRTHEQLAINRAADPARKPRGSGS
jgi:hypothetical protein